MDKIAVIVAAGSGTRMQSTLPKQFMPLAGKALLMHTVEAFIQAYADIKIILVLPESQLPFGRQLLQDHPARQQVQLVAGGNSRFRSVANGLQEVPEERIVFVHDGVRCLVSPQLIRRCYEAALNHDSAVPVCPATDSMRILKGEGPGQVSQSIDREKIRLVQTPQTFKSSLLKRAFEQPCRSSFTDEASVIEAMGARVHLVEGDPDNIKITRPVDLMIAAAILQQRRP